MASWQQIESEAAEFAAKVKERFESGTHKTLATLRRDGSPRISGSETAFKDGELTFGMMPGSMKLLDVRRDPRVAIHSPTSEPPKDAPQDWTGEAKLAGKAVEIPPPDDNPFPDSGFFRFDITEAVLTYVGNPPDHLVIESWHEGRGHTRQTRK